MYNNIGNKAMRKGFEHNSRTASTTAGSEKHSLILIFTIINCHKLHQVLHAHQFVMFIKDKISTLMLLRLP